MVAQLSWTQLTVYNGQVRPINSVEKSTFLHLSFWANAPRICLNKSHYIIVQVCFFKGISKDLFLEFYVNSFIDALTDVHLKINFI